MSKTTKEEIKEAAETDLLTFIKLVSPHRLLGNIHEELIEWWNRSDAKSHQLTLLPRGHQKSIMVAYRVAWEITRNPEVTILYISSTANLAEKQLKAIQDILTSKIYTRYWPEMINPQEGKREKWTTGEISVDHPKRKLEGIRDPTIFTAGLTTSITGLHCDIAVLDDVIVQENAYTNDGRNKVRTQYSLLSSIENPGALEWVVGTRYHPRDLYSDLQEMQEDIYDAEGELIGTDNIYELFERVVEDQGDGRGEFLWPKMRRNDGKWFGFDAQILAKKRGQYLDKTQFYAQYYNNPNDPTGSGISAKNFQYYDRKHLKQDEGYWFYKERKLNVFAAIDFAFSLKKKADFTAIAIVGVDFEGNIYVMDIERFKTDRIKEYFEKVMQANVKWGFRKIRAEVTVAQQAIVRELKEQIKQYGLALSVEEHRPNRHQGTKEERIAAVLEPRYDNLAMWHYRGGHCQTLEEELTASHPPHDDIKDALTSAIEISIPPKRTGYMKTKNSNIISHSRFGGVSFGR